MKRRIIWIVVYSFPGAIAIMLITYGLSLLFNITPIEAEGLSSIWINWELHIIFILTGGVVVTIIYKLTNKMEKLE